MLCRDVVIRFCEEFEKLKVDAVAGIESRGFYLDCQFAIQMGVPFITIRKKGKLPYKTVSYEYDLEIRKCRDRSA